MSAAADPQTSPWSQPERLPEALAAAWGDLEARCRKLAKRRRLAVDSIHQLRRACRALEAATLLVAPDDQPAGRRARQRLRRLRRRAGELRDMDVALAWLDRLAKRRRFAALAQAARRPLAQRRGRGQARLLSFLARHPRGGLARAGRELAEHLTKEPADPWSALGGLELALFERRRRTPLEPEALHRLRIAGKKVRWARRALGLEAPGQDPLGGLVSALGDAHDLWVTCRWLERLLPAATEPAARRALARLSGLAEVAHRRAAERWIGPPPLSETIEPEPIQLEVLADAESAFAPATPTEPPAPAIWRPDTSPKPPSAPN